MNKKQNKKIWREFWVLLKPFHKRFYFLIFFIVLIEAFSLTEPYILKVVIDKLTVFKPEEIKNIIYLVVLFFLVAISIAGIHYIRERFVFRYYFDIEYFFQTIAQEKLVNLSLSYHEKENTGNKIIKIDRGTQKILDLLSNLNWEVVPTVFQFIFTITVLLIIDWRFSGFILFFGPVFIFLTFYSNKIIYPFRKKRYKKGEEASGKMAQAIININAVKSFVQEKKEIKEFKNIRNVVRIQGIKEWHKLSNYWMGRNFIIDLGRFFTLLLATYLVFNNKISIGSMVFAITLSEKTYFSMYRLSRVFDKVEEALVAIERLFSILNEEQSIKNKKNAIKPQYIKGDIIFNKVNFSYNLAKGKALHNVSIKIKAGEVTALVGPSGGGKTTVARMIYRHYDSTSGCITLDGVDLRDYDLHAFRKFISIVPQEVEIFDSSIRDNIAYGSSNVSEQEVIAASKIANAEEFISKLPEKYNTLVGERGVKLSGGQRQRIGIARAILTNPRILIFDEATSNLDSYSENLIQQALDDIIIDRTVIIIAHRLSTIKKADKIIVFQDGCVVEEGTHRELARKKSGLYTILSNLQNISN